MCSGNLIYFDLYLLMEKKNQAAVGGLVSEDQLVLFVIEFNSFATEMK